MARAAAKTPEKTSAKTPVKKAAAKKAAAKKGAAKSPVRVDPVYETCKIERDGGITFLIMNRPEKRNAMSPQLHMDMNDAIDYLTVDPHTDVLVVTAAGTTPTSAPRQPTPRAEDHQIPCGGA